MTIVNYLFSLHPRNDGTINLNSANEIADIGSFSACAQLATRLNDQDCQELSRICELIYSEE